MSLCDSAANGSIQNLVRQHLFAAISREILKCGTSKGDKNAVKDFVKSLSLLNLSSWMPASLAPAMSKLSGLLFKATSDKASLKLIEKLSDDCDAFDITDLRPEEAKESEMQFYSAAPGLADLIETSSSSADESVGDFAPLLAVSSNKASIMSRPKLLPKTPSKARAAEAEDDEDALADEEEGVVSKKAPTKSSRPGRSSKTAAQSKISNQLAKENLVMND